VEWGSSRPAGRRPASRAGPRWRRPTGAGNDRRASSTGVSLSEVAQAGDDVLGELGEEALLVVAGAMEDQVVEAEVDVLLEPGDRGVGVGGDDPALGDLLDRQLVGQPLHLVGAVYAVLLLRGLRQRCPEPAVL